MFKRFIPLAAMLLWCTMTLAQSSAPAQTPAAQPAPHEPQGQVSIDPYQAYAEGRYADAFDGFANLQVKRPKDVDLMLNLGASLYRLKDYAGAEKAWALAAEHGDPNMRAEALYDMGNSAFQQKHLEQAVEHFQSALSLNPNDDDAAHNLRIAKKQLEMQQQQKNQDPNGPHDPQDPNQANSKQPQDPNQQDPKDPNSPSRPKDAQDPNAGQGAEPQHANDAQKPDSHDKNEPQASDAPSTPKDEEGQEGHDGTDASSEKQPGQEDEGHNAKRMPRSQAERLLDAMGESRPRHAPPSDKAGQRPPDGMDW